jgi:uncharacterized protein YjdB
MKRFVQGISLLVFCVIFVSCKKPLIIEKEDPKFLNFYNIHIRLLTGEERTVELSKTITNYPYSEIKYQSVDENIAKVINERTILSLAEGTTFIKALKGRTELDRFQVTVTDGVVTAISLIPATTTIKVGQTLKLNPFLTPVVAKDKSVVWDSSEPSVAIVDQSGLVTAVKEGIVEIYGTTVTKLKVICIVTVTK